MSSEAVRTENALVTGRVARIGVTDGALGRARYDRPLRLTAMLEVVGVVDNDLRVARAWARDLPGKPPAFETISSLLLAAPDLDAILLAAPLLERAGLIQQAAAARKSVFCDMPCTASLAEMDTLLQRLDESGVRFLPAFSRRFDPYFQALTAQAQAGVIGELRQTRCDWSFPVGGSANLANGGDLDDGWNLMLQHIACQSADLCRDWLGDGLSVSADILFPAKRALARTSSGQYPHGGAFANIIVTHARGQSTHHLTQSRSQYPAERWTLTGAQGRLELILSAGERDTALTTPKLFLHRAGQRPERLPVSAPDESLSFETLRLQRMLTHFAAIVTSGLSPHITGTDARAALEIVHAAYLSAREGNKITLPLRHSPDMNALIP